MKQRAESLKKIKKKLVDRRNEMMQELNDLAREKVSDGQVQDSGDEALSLSLERLKNSLEKSDIDELNQIDEALNKIEQGNYGICIECEQPISTKRLESSPYVARCIVCQENLEEKIKPV